MKTNYAHQQDDAATKAKKKLMMQPSLNADVNPVLYEPAPVPVDVDDVDEKKEEEGKVELEKAYRSNHTGWCRFFEYYKPCWATAVLLLCSWL